MSVFQRNNIDHAFSRLGEVFGEFISPQPLEGTQLLTYNTTLANQLGLTEQEMWSKEMLALLSGQGTLNGQTPFAMKYTGHQFGQYNPSLGDGRGLLLGEWQDSEGNWWDWHLKGSGKTPYSRQGDGRAVLRSTVREYLCGAAMQGLGIPTTLGLAIVSSETPVLREKMETAATLLRVSESHIRFGHFEYLFYSSKKSELQTLADFVIERHFPALSESENKYAEFFQNVVTRTAEMIAQWQAVGFNHGVMNTDNMSILGLTFDYGPFAFLDDFDPNYICNHSDYSGRYAFNQQPAIALWNLSALGYALTPLIETEKINNILGEYEQQLQIAYSREMRSKLGLIDKQAEDVTLFDTLFQMLETQHVDYTLFFRRLSLLSAEALTISSLEDLVSNTQVLSDWLEQYKTRIEDYNDEARRQRMLQCNPKFILRNYLAQQAIDAAENGDASVIENLMTVLSTPFDEHSDLDILASPPPNWGKCMEISCSS